jgi:hypothetical protein
MIQTTNENRRRIFIFLLKPLLSTIIKENTQLQYINGCVDAYNKIIQEKTITKERCLAII